ncbi:MAG TPA: ATP-binding protein [Pyrinomonadaceae bacterium]|nr:ATP-binding protein [Pyrinomonadaceae bacterium]
MFDLKENKSIKTANNGKKKTSKDAAKNPFDDVSKTPAGHFEIYFLATTADLMRRLEEIYGTREAVFIEFPFLEIYDQKLAGREPNDLSQEKAENWWKKTIFDWEKRAENHLPLSVLRTKFELEFSEILLLICIGLIEEDARFGLVFEILNEFSTEKRLTFGTVDFWQKSKNLDTSSPSIIYRLFDLGLINFGNTENPRSEWTLLIQPLLWDLMRGEKHYFQADWLKFTASKDLLSIEKLILSDKMKREISVLPALFQNSEIQVLVVRGAHHNSRKTILGAIAKSLDLNLVEIKNFDKKNDERRKIVNTLAVLLNAMPIFELDISPSETVEFPEFCEAVKAVGITLGKQGGLSGSAVEKAVTITANLPEFEERREHWKSSLEKTKTDELDEISERFRLSSGNIRRAGKLAKSYALLEKRENVGLTDVQKAVRSLNRQSLDTLAIYLEPLDADWNFLAVRDETLSDLRQLESRCRIRENLRNFVGKSMRGQLQAGVRALFNGGSGTGKTYAARLLAAALQKDIYRLDLSTIINKYIGETEKNLAKVFALVEELDVILLLDEGDSLLTQRTSVSSANDRYANLETNYLLQRLESFEGILIVTTNANDRIDSAFQRRMDTVIEFAAPTATERVFIWNLHLPEINEITDDFLQETIRRCELTGGQIRNVALHAVSLALSENEKLHNKCLEKAIRREYRKIGAVCPLKEKFIENVNANRW